MTGLEVDLVVLGAGGAGSAALIALDRAWHEAGTAPGPDHPLPPRVLVVDPVQRTGDDRTWCFWHAGPHDLDSLAHRAWALADVVTADGTRTRLELDPFRYLMLRSSDVYARAHEAARRLGARWITGSAHDLQDGPDGVRLQVGDQEVHARWVLDSRPGPPARPATTAWIQHFRGWTVRLPRPVLDVHVPLLMDLAVPQGPRQVSFVYLLPLDPDRALVEFTVFSPGALGRPPAEVYESGIVAHLADRFGLARDDVRIEAVEDGVIPMTDAGHRHRVGRHVVRLGTAGGATRASTGYTFAAMYRQAAEIAARLRAGRDPVPAAAYPRRHHAIDAVMLTALDTGLVDGARLLGSLWAAQPPDRLLRFLDGTSTPGEDLRVMRAAPTGRMALATGVWLGRRARAAVTRP